MTLLRHIPFLHRAWFVDAQGERRPREPGGKGVEFYPTLSEI